MPLFDNPQLKQFIADNKNKSIEDICNDYGLNFNEIKKTYGADPQAALIKLLGR